MKELKNQLKKESCYTSILTTARIRGVEKVRVSNQENDNKDFQVSTCTCAHVNTLCYYVSFLC